MLRKVFIGAAVIIGINALLRAGSVGTVFLSVLMWALVGYLIVRAWPAVSRDLRELSGLLRRRGPRLHRSGPEVF